MRFSLSVQDVTFFVGIAVTRRCEQFTFLIIFPLEPIPPGILGVRYSSSAIYAGLLPVKYSKQISYFQNIARLRRKGGCGIAREVEIFW
ncbi:MAG TPA: hypothetical protein VHU44_01390, partial [Acidobacteriaceae bacterium]|nr:hypothetical protein [Acidobacteriaceae bacterium]